MHEKAVTDPRDDAAALTEQILEIIWKALEDVDQPNRRLEITSLIATALQKAREEGKAWKEAVINACVVNEIGWDESDPRKTLNQLLAWEQQVALDPRVSKEAAALVAQGRREMAAGTLSRLREALEGEHGAAHGSEDPQKWDSTDCPVCDLLAEVSALIQQESK